MVAPLTAVMGGAKECSWEDEEVSEEALSHTPGEEGGFFEWITGEGDEEEDEEEEDSAEGEEKGGGRVQYR